MRRISVEFQTRAEGPRLVIGLSRSLFDELVEAGGYTEWRAFDIDDIDDIVVESDYDGNLPAERIVRVAFEVLPDDEVPDHIGDAPEFS